MGISSDLIVLKWALVTTSASFNIYQFFLSVVIHLHRTTNLSLKF